jgi:hypothetical protein
MLTDHRFRGDMLCPDQVASDLMMEVDDSPMDRYFLDATN